MQDLFFNFQMTFTDFFKWSIIVKQFIHVQKKVVKIMINIIFFKIKNKIVFYLTTVPYKLLSKILDLDEEGSDKNYGIINNWGR